MSDLATLLGDGDGPAVNKTGPGIAVVRQTSGDITVGREGEVVTFQIGNSLLRFKYRDAFQIGQALMIKAQECKMLLSDTKPILAERR